MRWSLNYSLSPELFDQHCLSNLVGKCETTVLVKGWLEKLVRETWSRPERATWESGGKRESRLTCFHV